MHSFAQSALKQIPNICIIWYWILFLIVNIQTQQQRLDQYLANLFVVFFSL